MMVSNQGRLIGLLRWQWRNVALFLGASTLTTAAMVVSGLDQAIVPALPLAVVGGAMGIFVSFRTNSAYDRWWEARKLWGRLINTSRHWCSQVLCYVPEDRGASALVRRHIAYVHTLRCLLRLESPLADSHVPEWLDEVERAELASQSNATHYLLFRQARAVSALADAGVVTEQRLESLDASLRELLDIQGGCERIKKTPVPRGYGYIAESLIRFYALLLPLAIAHDLSWFAIPITVLVCLAFALISEAGRVLEDPFTWFWNGLPLSNMSTTIEHNLRNRLGEFDLPPIPGPDADGILM